MAKGRADDPCTETAVEQRPGASAAKTVGAEARHPDAVLRKHGAGAIHELASEHRGGEVRVLVEALVLPRAAERQAVYRQAYCVKRGREGLNVGWPGR